MAIYYLCPDSRTPVGGIRVIYRHVDILNEHGIPAFVVHKKMGFRVPWFENNTPIVYWCDTRRQRLKDKIKRRTGHNRIVTIPIKGGPFTEITGNDILAVPEKHGPDLARAIGRGIPRVILNQNCYLTFRGYSLDPKRLITPYHDKSVLATLINSHDGDDYLQYVFPETPRHRFRLSIDPGLFSYQGEKKKQICFSRIKNQRDAMQVVNILKFRGALDEFDIVPFLNIPQAEVAETFKQSLICLSFGYPEGFGLPAAEAMACGCVVVGFHGGGGKEFFKPEFSYPIEQGDIIGFARAVEELIALYKREPDSVHEKGRMAASFISETYSQEIEEREVLGAWKDIISEAEGKARPA